MKKFIVILLTPLFFVLLSQKANAVTIEAQSDRTSTTQTFIILANPRTDSTAAQLRLNIEGGTVTSFSASDDRFLSIGTCNQEASKYTPTSICTDIATSVGILGNADVLGVFTVERNDQFTQLRITKAENNGYVGANGLLQTDSGVAFTLFGSDIVQDKPAKSSSNAIMSLSLIITFLMGVVVGTTFTTLGHVLQAGKLHQKRNKKD